MILPVAGAPFVVPPKSADDYDAASPVIQDLLDKGTRFVAVAGMGLLAPGDTGQLNDRWPERGEHCDRLRQGSRRVVRVPGRQLHTRPDPGSVPRPGQRYRRAARRRRFLGDRVAP